VSSPGGDSDYAWLRTSPNDLPSETPSSFTSMVKKRDVRWNQVYMEWLTGATNGAKNSDRVVGAFAGTANEDMVVRWFQSLAADPDKKRGFDTWDIAPDAKYAKYEASYPAFAAEITTIRKAIDFRAKLITHNQKLDGVAKPDKKAALKQAGKAVQRMAWSNAVESQGGELGVSVGLAVQMQIEQYKVSGLQMYLDALAQLEDTPWDTPETSGIIHAQDPNTGRYRAEALAVLRGAGADVIASAGRLKDATMRLLDTEPGVGSTAQTGAAGDDMFDALLDFQAALGQQGQALARAGTLVGTWAERATKNMLEENFNTVFPKLGFVMLGFRTAIAVTNVVFEAVPPPYNLIGKVTLAYAPLEWAAKKLAVSYTGKSQEVQLEHVGQEYVVPSIDELNLAGKAFVVANLPASGVHAVFEHTVGKAGAGIQYGGKKIAQLLQDETVDVQASIAKETQGALANAKDLLFDRRDGLLGPLTDAPNLAAYGRSALEAAVPSLAKAALKAVPYAGTAFTVGIVAMEWTQYGEDQQKVLRNRAGLTDEDIRQLQELIVDKGGGNPLFSLLQAGQTLVEPKEEGADHFYVQASGCRMRIVLYPAPRIDNVDEAVIFRAVKPEARMLAPERIDHQGHVFALDWDTARLLGFEGPMFTIRVGAAAHLGGQPHPVELDLLYDNLHQDLRVGAVHGDVPADGVLVKLQRFDAGQAQAGAAQPQNLVTADDVALAVSGREVIFDGQEYVLSSVSTPQGVVMDPGAGTVTFNHSARRKADNRRCTLYLVYGAADGLGAYDVDVTEDQLAAKLASGRPLTSDDVVKRFAGVPVGYTPRGAEQPIEYVLTEQCLTSAAQGGQVRFAMKAAGGETLSLLFADDELTVVSVDPEPVLARAGAGRRARPRGRRGAEFNLLDPGNLEALRAALAGAGEPA
jgi:hypothetical protein